MEGGPLYSQVDMDFKIVLINIFLAAPATVNGAASRGMRGILDTHHITAYVCRNCHNTVGGIPFQVGLLFPSFGHFRLDGATWTLNPLNK